MQGLLGLLGILDLGSPSWLCLLDSSLHDRCLVTHWQMSCDGCWNAGS